MQLALRDRDDDFAAHNLALQVRVGVVLAGEVVAVVRRRCVRREAFELALYTFQYDPGFDTVLAKPVATAYKELPDPVQGWVRNFFANIADLWIGINNLISFIPLPGAEESAIGFIPDLSVLDLLLTLGPRARELLLAGGHRAAC